MFKDLFIYLKVKVTEMERQKERGLLSSDSLSIWGANKSQV